MNREQKRKEARKNKKIGDDFIPEKTTKSEVNRLIGISFVVILIFVILYFVIGIFITKEIKLPRSEKQEQSNITIDPTNIIAKSTFNQKEEIYYVYFYDFKNEDKTIADIIKNKLVDSKIYKVDTADIVNKNFVVENDSNKNAKNIDELKVKENTIIKITNNQVEGYYEGIEEIENNLK